MKKIVSIFLSSLIISTSASAETLYVTATKLNGRAKPTKNSTVEMRLERGDAVEPLRFQNGWVEVVGGEFGTAWLSMDYLSEIKEPKKFQNISGGRVKVRKSPEGKHVDWIKTGKVVTVERIISGWGYTSRGWIDLQYFEEVIE